MGHFTLTCFDMLPDMSMQCIPMWLQGLSREEIARRLGISEGSVVNIINRGSQDDSSLELQRELALFIKRTRTNIFQISSDVRFHNALKRLAAKEDCILEFLSELQKHIDSQGIGPEQAIDAIANISAVCVQERVPADKVFQRIQDGYAELEKVNSELDQAKRTREVSTRKRAEALLDNRLTEKDLAEYRSTREIMKDEGLSLGDLKSTLRVIKNLKSLRFSHKKIIDNYRGITNAEDTLQKLKQQCDWHEDILEKYKHVMTVIETRFGNYQKALEVIGAATNMGLKTEHIFAAVSIFSKFGNDFAPEEIIKDLEVYGSLRLAHSKYIRELENSLFSSGLQTKDN